MSRILIIGQAPPAVTQSLPYSTTMLYSWLEEVGIDSNQAQSMFDFEAVSNKFPGFKMGGGHLPPSAEDMDNHWKNTLQSKVECADKIWLLGGVARDYFYSKDKTWSCNMEILETIHPSSRNKGLYKQNKETIITNIRNFLNK